jgi:hypothetical protein
VAIAKHFVAKIPAEARCVLKPNFGFDYAPIGRAARCALRAALIGSSALCALRCWAAGLLGYAAAGRGRGMRGSTWGVRGALVGMRGNATGPN